MDITKFEKAKEIDGLIIRYEHLKEYLKSVLSRVNFSVVIHSHIADEIKERDETARKEHNPFINDVDSLETEFILLAITDKIDSLKYELLKL